MSQELINLPKDILYQLLFPLDLSTLSKLCLTNKQFQNICEDPRIWKIKSEIEFGIKFPTNKDLNYKQIFIQKTTQYLLKQLYTDINNYLLSTVDYFSKDKMDIAAMEFIMYLVEVDYINNVEQLDLHARDMFNRIIYNNDINTINNVSRIENIKWFQQINSIIDEINKLIYIYNDKINNFNF